MDNVEPEYARARKLGRYLGTSAFRLSKLGVPVVYTRTWDKKRLRQELLFRRDIKPSGCWEWKGSRHDFGYGLICIEGKQYNVCTVSLWVFKNDDGPRFGGRKIQALHHCDNPSCFRPAHLYSGTQKENIDDMVRRGRHWGLARTHCKYGHLLTKESVYVGKTRTGTKRTCRVCHSIYMKAYTKKHPELKLGRWKRLADTIKFHTEHPLPLTSRRRKILTDLRDCCDRKPRMGKITCEDLGGTNGSHHYYTLSKLALESLVGRKKPGCRCEAGQDAMFGHKCKVLFTYWIAPRGRKFLAK